MTSAAAPTSPQESLELPDPGFKTTEQQQAKKLKPRELAIQTRLFFHALETGNQEMALQMIERGVDLEARLPEDLVRSVDDNGNTPLIRAVRRKNAAVVKALLDAGADPNHLAAGQKLPILFCSFDPDSRFENKDSIEELEILKLLIEKGAILPEDLVMRLIETGQLQKFEYLHQQGKVDFGSTDPDSEETILHKLSMEEQLGDWREYFNEALRVCEIDAANQDGETALHGACDFVIIDAAEELIKNGADIDAKDDLGLTPIMHTIKSNLAQSEDDRLDLVKILVEYESGLALITNGADMCALHFAVNHAAKSKDYRVLKLIIDTLQSQGLSIDKPNENLEISSTELALMGRNEDIYDLLVSKGATEIIFSPEIEAYMAAKKMSRADIINHENPRQLEAEAAEFVAKIAKSQESAAKLLKQEEKDEEVVAEKAKRKAKKRLKKQTARVAKLEKSTNAITGELRGLKTRVESLSSRSIEVEAKEKAKKEEQISLLSQEVVTKTEEQIIEDILEKSIATLQKRVELEARQQERKMANKISMPEIPKQRTTSQVRVEDARQEKPKAKSSRTSNDQTPQMLDIQEVHKRIDAEIAQDETAELRAQMMALQSQLEFHDAMLNKQYGQNQYLAHQNQLLGAEVARLSLILNQTIGINQSLAAGNHYLHRRLDGLTDEFGKFKDRLDRDPRLESRSEGGYYFTPPLSTDSDRSSTPSDGRRSPPETEDEAVTESNLKFTTLHGIEAEIDPSKKRTPITKQELQKLHPGIISLENEDLDRIFKPPLRHYRSRSSSLPDLTVAEGATKETPSKAEVATYGIKAETAKRRLILNQDLAEIHPSESPPSKKVEDPSSPYTESLVRRGK